MAKPPPRIAGRALTLARIAAESPGTDLAIREVMRRGLGIDEVARLPASWRGEIPVDARPQRARAPRRWSDLKLPTPGLRDWPRTAAAYTDHYARRAATPRQVAERALDALESLAAMRPTMNVLAASSRQRSLADADAASARYEASRPLGPLDGVPFLVKDEFDVAGLPTRLGSRCEPDTPVANDSTVVGRLRRAGAVFVGKTVLTEWGMSPVGGNINARMPHNVFDASHAPGGSSTGSAVGVALGVSPIAAGGDGGGSIRIPAALNGVFGIKPTFGRVSRAGDGFKGSLAHAGPIASSTADLAAFLDAVAAERDDRDPLTEWAPPPPDGGFGSLLGAGVKGLRIGVPERAWQQATDAVARAGRDALRALERDGAELVPVSFDIGTHAAKIGYLTIGPESLAMNRDKWIDRRGLLGEDLRLAYAVLASIPALEQLDAQRLRTGLRYELAAVLRTVDVVAMPTTAITAPKYTEEDARSSFSDPAALDGLCRFAFLANLTGVPAATAPVGADEMGLAIGLQILGDAWDEATVLAVLAHLERSEVARVRRPPAAVDLLTSA